MIKVLARSDSYNNSSSLYLTDNAATFDGFILCDESEWEIVQTCAQKFTYADVKQLKHRFKSELNRVADQRGMNAAVIQWNYGTVSMELERYESLILV